MPTIRMFGRSPTGGGRDPRSDRGAAFDAYEAQRRASDAESARRDSEMEAAWRRRDAADTSRSRDQDAAWQRHDRAEKDNIRAREQLLARETRLHDQQVRQQALRDRRQETQRQKWERVKVQDERRGQREEQQKYRSQRAEADYENRNRDAAMRSQERVVRQEMSRRRVFDRFNANLGRLQAHDASRPGMLGRVALGAARVVGGAGMRDRVARAFNIGGGGGSIPPSWAGPMGGALEGESAAFGGAARIAGVAGIAYEIGKMAYNLPNFTSNMFNSRLANAQPYTSLRQGAANAGTAYGFNGNDLASAFYPGDGTTPEWMSRLGVTPQGAMRTLDAYGMPYGSAALGTGIAQSAYEASRMPWLGGMAPERYAQSLGTMQQLGGFDMGSQGPSGPGFSTSWQSRGMTPADYFREMQKVTAAGMTIGLDRSQVLGNIETMTRATASMNAAGGPNVGGMADMWWRVASGGSMGGRTGEAQMSIMQANANFTAGAGFGGNVNASMMYHQYFARNGGVPKTREALEKQLGVSYGSLGATDKAAFDSALDAAQHGNEAAFFTLLDPFLKANPALVNRMAEGSGLVPGGGYMRPLLGGAYTGQTPYQYQQGNTGAPMPSNASGAARHNPLNLRYVGQKDAIGTPSGFGMYQSDEAGVAAAERQLMLYRGHGTTKLRDIISKWAPPSENDTAAYIAAVSKETGWSPDEDINVADPTQASKLIIAMSARETHRLDPGVVGRGLALAPGGGPNMLPDINPLIATGGQAQTGAAEKSLREGDILLNTVGPAMLTFSSYVTQATRALAEFTVAATGATGNGTLSKGAQTNLKITGPLTVP